MKITIITISYNSEKTIEDTIKSVITQKNENIEYIIVDGNSTDRTLEIINKYSDEIDLIVSEPDNGICDAFNKGIKLSSGQLIGIINSDDLLMEDAINKLKRYFDDKTDVYYGNAYRLFASGNKKEYLSDSNLINLKKKMCLVHPSTFITKEAYLKYGLYNAKYRCVMDRDLLLRMYSGGAKFKYVNEFLTVYRMGGISEKQYFECVIPEDRRISLYYGASKPFVYIRSIYTMFKMKIIFIRNKILYN